MPLVRAAQAGDRESFDALYRRHARTVRAVLLGRVARDEIDDLAQEAFLAAWRQLGSLRDPAAFGGWVVTIARHLRVDRARQRPDASSLDDERTPRDLAVADTAAEQRRAGDRLDAGRALAAVQSLPAAYRETLLLRLVEGMTGPEIAARTGLTPGSVRVNLCRGLERLRAVLADDDSRVRDRGRSGRPASAWRWPVTDRD